MQGGVVGVEPAAPRDLGANSKSVVSSRNKGRKDEETGREVGGKRLY